MADLKLVGAVAIKVRPDASGFRGDTQKQIDRELAGVNAEVEVEAKLESAEAKADAKKLEKELSGKEITWKVKLDHDSVRAAQKKLASLLEPSEDIKFKLDDQDSIDKARARLKELSKAAQVTITYSKDERGYNEVLAKIDALRRQKIEKTINWDTDTAALDVLEAKMLKKLSKIPTTFEYDENAEGLRKVIAEIDAQLAKNHVIQVDTTLDDKSLLKTRARLEAELQKQTVRIEYDENLASLMAAKAEIEGLLGIKKLAIETTLDHASLEKALAEVDLLIAKNKPDVDVKVKPQISFADYLKVATAIKALTKNQTVGVFVKLNNASVLLAAAKLTGLRAAARWTEELGRAIGSLDRNLPIVGAVVLTLNTLASGIISLTASAFSLGNGLGEVVRMAGLLAPAMILGLGAVMLVMKGVFKDFGAAVNGDTKAIEKLTESGQKAAANIRVSFQDIRETVSANFWKSAGDSMLEFTKTALPSVRDGLATLSTSMGGIFSRMLDGFSDFSKQNGIGVFFTNLTRGFDVAQTGMAHFMSGFLTLATVGSTVFPRIGSAFEAWAGRFDSWVQRLAADGTLNRWIDKGIAGLDALGHTAGSLVKIWQNVGFAAQGAGGLTLDSLSAMTAKLAQFTAGDKFQTDIGNIFRGAREGSDQLHAALSKLGPAMDQFTLTVKNGLSNSGAALAAFVQDLGDILGSKNLDTGLTAFLGGLKIMFEQLRPAAAPISEIIKTLGQVLGQVASDSGPLFRTLFQQLAPILTTAWQALEPFLPTLINVGTAIVRILGPALSDVAGSLLPKFATAVVDIGEALEPVVQFLSDFAVAAAGIIADTPVPILVGMATAILTLGGAMKFAATVIPIVNGALKLFGATVALTEIQATLAIPVIGIFLAALSGLAIGGVTALATAQGDSTPAANEYADALAKDAEAAGKFGSAVGELSKKVAIKNLLDSGAFDAAKKLGIGVGDLTTAVLNGGPALDEIEAKLNGFTDKYHDAALGAIALAQGQDGVVDSTNTVSKELGENSDLAQKLKEILDKQRNSVIAGTKANEISAEAYKAAGIQTEAQAEATKKLTAELDTATNNFGPAAAATRALTDEFASGAAKIDAMRKTFDLLVGKDPKQTTAETLGAYVKGFNDLKASVEPIAQDMRNLGDAAFGENGFLNVASGNKAVLQVNQALKDQVDNTWLGAKQVYDNARKSGETMQQAFADAQKFADDRKVDFDNLAEASGVDASKVHGQWDAVFGNPWVLQVTLEGATEAATRAKAMVEALKGNFDGKKFQAFLDMNPDQALLATYDATTVAKNFVNTEWKAELRMLPGPAQDTIKKMVGVTDEVWVKGDFQAILTAAQNVPGLADVLIQIKNGASNNGQNWQAILYAALNGVSVDQARATLNALANEPRTAYIQSVILPPNSGTSGMDLFLAQNGGGGSRYGSILDGLGRGLAGFNAERIKFYANGGIENHVAQITRAGGPVRVWAEKETHGEAYLPLAASKRPRSVQILKEVARRFGYEVSKSGTHYANGGINAPSPVHNQADVHIGTLVTTDMDAAVRKLNQSRRDAMAVAGLRP